MNTNDTNTTRAAILAALRNMTTDDDLRASLTDVADYRPTVADVDADPDFRFILHS
jgi:hypothetical protein